MRGRAGRVAAVVLLATGCATVLVAPAAGAASDDVDAYIRWAHETLVGRPASPDEVGSWAPVVERDDRVSLTLALTTSARWGEHQVERLYAEILHRAPDPGAAQHWTAVLGAGAEPRDVAAHLHASAEHRYRERALDPGAFVDLLYRSILGRVPDAGGRSHWVAALERGMPEVEVAVHLLRSGEAVVRAVDATYRELLGRSAAVEEAAWWAPHLGAAGQRPFEAAVAASAEAYSRATGTRPAVAATSNLSGWQGAAGGLGPARLVVAELGRTVPRPAVVGLAEVCASGDPAAPGQLEHLDAELSRLGYALVWSPSIVDFARPGCADFGNLLAVQGTVRWSTSVDFGAQRFSTERDYREVRNIACAESVRRDGSVVVGCATHLVNPLPRDLETTRRQAGEALDVVRALPGGVRFVTGDLNLDPADPALDRWYASFREADPRGRAGAQPTTDGGAKRDYVFASLGGTSSATAATVVPLPTSDHHWVAGIFRLVG